MSTTSVSSSSTSSTTGYQLNSLGTSTGEQVTGLASGMNTDQIVQEEMSIYNQPVVAMQNHQSGLKATNAALTSVQTELQQLESDAQALGDPSLYDTSQAVTSSDPTRVTATTTTGAGIGGYQVSVTALANSAQRTFNFTSPTGSADTTVTIDNQPVTIPAGQTASEFANSINGNANLDVYAAATSSGTIVFSNRATGDTGANFIQVSDPQGALTEVAGTAVQGQNASYSIGTGPPVSSASNTVTTAIPGVTLTLSGLTTTSGPVTINVAPPAESSSNITAAVQTFITQYNSVISDLQSKLSTPPSSSDPTVGTLYQDPGLSNLLSSMRSAMYRMQNAGSSSSIQSMLDIGVSTGVTTGSGAVAQSALSGTLQLNTTTLTNAVTADPAGVQQMMVGFAATFSTLVGGQADPGGSIDSRIQGDDTQYANLGNQIAAMQSSLADKQNQLVQQFAQLEAALSSNQSTASWLTSQIAQLPGV